jgi:tRNA(fMet)-specific endonuclease VapC
MLYLLDTNVLSRLARGNDARIDQMLRRHDPKCRMSAISWYELTHGAARSTIPERSRRKLDFLREIFPDIEAFGEEASTCAGYVRFSLETLRPNAQPIGPYDVLLAGHAIALGATFVTHNTREFGRVSGLKVEDWQSQ